MSSRIAARLELKLGLLVLAFSTASAAPAAPPAGCQEQWQYDIAMPGFNGPVGALTTYNGHLIAGGSFTSAGGVAANRVARWDGQSWQPLGSGMNASVSALTVFNGELIAGGLFTNAGGANASYLARWSDDTNAWQPLGGGVAGDLDGMFPVWVRALTVYNNNLIVGGSFYFAGGAPVFNVASWNGASWSNVGGGVSGSHDPKNPPSVYALVAHNGELIVGGEFTQAGQAFIANIARWNGATWQAVAGTLDFWVSALAVFEGHLIAGGGFEFAGPVNVNHVARWPGAPSGWQPLGGGMSNEVMSLHVHNENLFAGGSFIQASGETVNRIARWQPAPFGGGSWQALDGGVDGTVRALASHGGDLIVAGLFLAASGAPANRIAAWGCPAGAIPGDLNGDGSVGVADLLILLAAWGPCADCSPGNCPADLDGDCNVGVSDLLILLANWG